MQNKLQIVLLFLLLALTTTRGTALAGQQYLYENCADQGFGVPLENCARLVVGAALDSLEIRDMREQTNGDYRKKNEFYYLDSKSAPIAVPISNYTQRDSWDFGGKKFLKISKSRAKFLGKGDFDLIVVLPMEKVASGEARLRDRIDELLLSFWYSPSAGVAAIAFPSKSQNGDVYFCASDRCLFQAQ